MKTNNTLLKIMAIIISIAVMLPGMPVSAFAEDNIPLGASCEIIAFAALDEGVANQSVPLGTSLEALNLPDSLTATVEITADETATDGVTQAGPTTIDVPVTWTAAPDYDGGAADTYIFTADVGDGFTLTATATLPIITVTVGAVPQAANFAMPFAAATTYELGDYPSPTATQYDWSTVVLLTGTVLKDGDTIKITAAPGSATDIILGTIDNITIIGMGGTNIPNLSIGTSAANLTLKDITMTAGSGACVYFVGTNLNTLTVEGTVKVTGSGVGVAGIYSSGALEIKGTGSLNATGGSGTYGIFADGNLAISAKTMATGGDFASGNGGDGIYSMGAITITGSAGQVIAKGGNATGMAGMAGITNNGGIGVSAWGDITVSAKLTATGGDSVGGSGGSGIFSRGAVTITGSAGEVKATGGHSTGGGYGGGFGVDAIGDITISSKLTATGGNSAAGRGGYGIYSDGAVIINQSAGEVTASGGSATGAGYNGGSGVYAIGNITVSAKLTATGGDSVGGYGGGGIFSSNGVITINQAAGQVTATGGSATGATGYGGYGIVAIGDITVSAGLTATGGAAEAPGDGITGLGNITIDAVITAKAGACSAGWGAGIFAMDGAFLQPTPLPSGVLTLTSKSIGSVIKGGAAYADIVCNYIVLPEGSGYILKGLDANGDLTDKPVSVTYTSVPAGKTSGSSSSSGKKNTTPSAPSNTPADVSKNQAADASKQAAEAAKASGADTATVRIKNVSNIKLDALKTMAKSAGMPVNFQADSMSADGKSVDVRITIDPAKSTKDLNLSASTTNDRAKETKAFFEKHYSNNVSVVSLGQQGGFGQPVEIAAKIDPKLDTKNLVFYSYDKATNTYKPIPNTNYWIDKNGYVHFTTDMGGEIVISDGPLERK